MELVNVEEDCRRVINMVIKDYNNVLVWKILDIEVLKDFLGIFKLLFEIIYWFRCRVFKWYFKSNCINL